MDYGFTIESAKAKGAVVDPPAKQPMRANGDKIRRNPSTDQKRVRRELAKKASLTPLVTSGYYNRASSAENFEVLCDRHGNARWGDPFEGDGQAAFNARLADKSGDWCWAPNVGAPCVECEKEALAKKASLVNLARTAQRTGRAEWRSTDQQVTAQLSSDGTLINVAVAHPEGLVTASFADPRQAALWMASFDIDRPEPPSANPEVLSRARAAVVRGTTESLHIAREFSEEERKKLADEGKAMPDGSFPIVTEEDLRNAEHAIGRAKDPDKARAWVNKRRKEMHGSKTAETHAPYYIRERDGKYVVVNDIDEVKGTFDTWDEARQQQKALYALVPGAKEEAEEKHQSSLKTAGRFMVRVPDTDGGYASWKDFDTREEAQSYADEVNGTVFENIRDSQEKHEGSLHTASAEGLMRAAQIVAQHWGGEGSTTSGPADKILSLIDGAYDGTFITVRGPYGDVWNVEDISGHNDVNRYKNYRPDPDNPGYYTWDEDPYPQGTYKVWSKYEALFLLTDLGNGQWQKDTGEIITLKTGSRHTANKVTITTGVEIAGRYKELAESQDPRTRDWVDSRDAITETTFTVDIGDAVVTDPEEVWAAANRVNDVPQEAGRLRIPWQMKVRQALDDNKAPSMSVGDTVTFEGPGGSTTWRAESFGFSKVSAKTAVSLTNVGFEGGIGSNVAVGTDPQGNRVRFRLSDKEAKDLASVLTGDLAMNFSGVDVDESDIIREGAKTAGYDDDTDYSPFGGEPQPDPDDMEPFTFTWTCSQCGTQNSARIVSPDQEVYCSNCAKRGTAEDQHTITAKTAAIPVCPQCGGKLSDITVKGLTMTASCHTCGWSGKRYFDMSGLGSRHTADHELDGTRGHKLLTQQDRKKLPPLYAQENKGDEAMAYVKFFSPYSGWYWYATEFDGEDTFFGLVMGFETELGYFSLSELESANSNGLPLVERDLGWEPRTLAQVKAERNRYGAKTAATIPDPGITCNQCHQRPATVYAIDPIPGGWGGHYCDECAGALGFQVVDRYVSDKTARAHTPSRSAVTATSPKRAEQVQPSPDVVDVRVWYHGDEPVGWDYPPYPDSNFDKGWAGVDFSEDDEEDDSGPNDYYSSLHVGPQHTAHTHTAASLLDQLYMDIFITAIEGGINYWASVSNYHWGETLGNEDYQGFYADIVDNEDEGKTYHVDRSVIARGYRLATGEWRNKISWSSGKPPLVVTQDTYDDIDLDAGDADVIVQLGLFGDVIYG